MRRAPLALVALTVLGGGVPAPAISARAKPQPVTVALFLRDEAADECNPSSQMLKFADGPDTEACGNATDGVGNEVLIAAGQEPTAFEWYMPGKVNVTLDASKDIACRFGLSGGGGGRPTLEVKLTGNRGGAIDMIAEGSVTYAAAPSGPAPLEPAIPVELTIAPDKSLHKKKFTGLTLTTLVRGVSARHGFFRLDDPPSYCTMSILTPGGKLPRGASKPPA